MRAPIRSGIGRGWQKSTPEQQILLTLQVLHSVPVTRQPHVPFRVLMARMNTCLETVPDFSGLDYKALQQGFRVFTATAHS